MIPQSSRKEPNDNDDILQPCRKSLSDLVISHKMELSTITKVFVSKFRDQSRNNQWLQIRHKAIESKRFTFQSQNKPRPITKKFNQNNYRPIAKQSKANHKILHTKNCRPIRRFFASRKLFWDMQDVFHDCILTKVEYLDTTKLAKTYL